MRSRHLVLALFSLTAFAAAQVACSSDDSSNNQPPPSTGPQVQDSGAFAFVDAGGVTIKIQGAGTVFGGFSAPGDAGQTVACTSDGTTTSGSCHADIEDTLYASAANGSIFDHWDPIGSTASSLFVANGTPDPITAVFKVDTTGGPVDAGPPPPPHDSGSPQDTGAADAPSDTGSSTDSGDAGHD